MRNTCWMLLLAGAIGLTATGCATMNPTMRAQSPCGEGCQDCHTGGAGGWGHGDCQSCNTGQGQPLSARQARKLARKNGGGVGSCPAGARCRGGADCHGGCLNLPFHPVHRNFHTYDVPTDLSYPDANQPPAFVQWPYYTFRGPTDFFMK